jgi:PAS domain S-box-containing protein
VPRLAIAMAGFQVGEVNTTELLIELPDCVLVLNEFGHVQWGNKAAEQLFGRSLRDSVGFPALDLVHPDDLELVLRSLESVQRKDVGTLIEVRARTATGWRLLEVIGAPIGWSDEPSAVLFCLRDLTERRRFEVARNKEATFRTVVQNSPDITILLSESGMVDSVSGALSRILGHDPEVIEGGQLIDLVVGEDQPAFLASLHAASQGATASDPLRVRIRLVRHGAGEPVPFEFTFVNLLDDQTVGGFVVSAHDIRAQVAAERELYQSEQRFRRVFNQGPLGIVLTDFDHAVIDVNDAFCLLVGQPSDKVIGSAFHSFVHIDDRGSVLAVGRQLKEQTTKTCRTESRLESRNHEVVVSSVTASVIEDENGVPHCLWILEDITERKLLEGELAAHASTAATLLSSLTSREVEILELLEQTATASQMALCLTLSVRTVESHLANAYRKLGVHSRSAAIDEFARLRRAVAGVRLDQN